MKPFTLIVSSLTLAMLSLSPLTGCSSPRQSVQQSVEPAEQIGSVRTIEIIALDNRSTGGGAVLGAVLGGVIGNQFGSGSGRSIATGVGVVGGAMAGNQVEKNNKTAEEIYRVTVDYDNGRTQLFDYQQIGDLRPGDRVRVSGSQIYQL